MAEKKNCIFCGRSYNYCPSCREYSRYPLWMSSFDTEKCHDMYEVIGGYGMGIKTKEDIQAVLDKHNITDYSVFSDKLRNKLEFIFGTTTINVEEKPIENKDDVVDMIDETESVETAPVIENVESEKKYAPRRKRGVNRKYNFENEANTEE